MDEVRLFYLVDKAEISGLSPEEQTELDTWLQASEANRATYAEIQSISVVSRAPLHAADPQTDAEWQRLQGRLQQPQGRVRAFRPQVMRITAAAAAVLLLAMVGYLVFGGGGGESMTYATARGIKKELNLSDGSRVFLNSGSELTTAAGFGKTNRNLSLLGEAYFEVARDEEMPFIIDAGETRTEVLGTRFNIDAHNPDQAIKISVVGGKVRFSDRDKQQSAELVRDEAALYDAATGTITKLMSRAEDEAGWRNGKLVFEDVPLPQALEEIGRYYDVTFELGPQLERQYLSTEFNNQSLKDVLETLTLLYGAQVTQEGKQVLLKK